MSKIANGGLTRSGTGCFIAVPIWQQWAAKGLTATEMVTVWYKYSFLHPPPSTQCYNQITSMIRRCVRSIWFTTCWSIVAVYRYKRSIEPLQTRPIHFITSVVSAVGKHRATGLQYLKPLDMIGVTGERPVWPLTNFGWHRRLHERHCIPYFSTVLEPFIVSMHLFPVPATFLQFPGYVRAHVSLAQSHSNFHSELRKKHVFWNRVHNDPSRTSKVTVFGTNRKRVWVWDLNLLLVLNSNLAPFERY